MYSFEHKACTFLVYVSNINFCNFMTWFHMFFKVHKEINRLLSYQHHIQCDCLEQSWCPQGRRSCNLLVGANTGGCRFPYTDSSLQTQGKVFDSFISPSKSAWLTYVLFFKLSVKSFLIWKDRCWPLFLFDITALSRISALYQCCHHCDDCFLDFL